MSWIWPYPWIYKDSAQGGGARGCWERIQVRHGQVTDCIPDRSVRFFCIYIPVEDKTDFDECSHTVNHTRDLIYIYIYMLLIMYVGTLPTYLPTYLTDRWWPDSRPVPVLVPFPPGGEQEKVLRVLAEYKYSHNLPPPSLTSQLTGTLVTRGYVPLFTFLSLPFCLCNLLKMFVLIKYTVYICSATSRRQSNTLNLNLSLLSVFINTLF